ncbi:MAG: hypothetical protein L0H12_03935, partial [Nitrosospira sp.]|nr:hypothetical protein [Nitrosospira sp.]
RIVVHVSSGKRPQYLHLSAGALINCTGPNTRLQETTNPLLKTLLAHGMIRHDSLSIGIDLDGNYHPLDTQGIPLDGLYYLGPMLQARYWEATAVPELREHAGRLAGIVSGQLDAMSAREGKSGCRTSP